MEFLTEPVSHDEAADFIKSKPAVTRAVFDKLLPELKARAFTVAGLERANELQAVRDLIAEIPQGGDWEETKRQIAALLPYAVDPDADPDEQASQRSAGDRRAELLLRLHGFQAYSAASHNAIMEQADIFPYCQYKSMGDGKVRHTHAALNDIILPTTDPFWSGHTGPWEWGCRCQKVGLMDIDVEEIREADKGKPLEKQRIIEGEARRQLVEHGRLVRGVNEIYDVRTPVQKGQKNAFAWNPGDMHLPLETLKARYDAPVWDAFQGWAETQQISPGFTVWQWLNNQQTAGNPIQQNETPSLRIRPGNGQDDSDPALARRAGRAGQRLLRSVYRGLHSEGDAPSAEAINGAEIAAAAAGTKPLFHEQLVGDLARIARALSAKLPPGAVAARIPGAPGEADHLVVYRPEAIARVFDSDPAFYRPNGEDDAAALRLAIENHSLGELLGYGQRTHFDPGAVRVEFLVGQHIFAAFLTRPELAADLARSRVAEYASFLEKKVRFEIK